jgi:hypothetical protein
LIDGRFVFIRLNAYQVVEDLEQLSNDEDLVKRIVEEENQRERRTKKKVANTKGMQD